MGYKIEKNIINYCKGSMNIDTYETTLKDVKGGRLYTMIAPFRISCKTNEEQLNEIAEKSLPELLNGFRSPILYCVSCFNQRSVVMYAAVASGESYEAVKEEVKLRRAVLSEQIRIRLFADLEPLTMDDKFPFEQLQNSDYMMDIYVGDNSDEQDSIKQEKTQYGGNTNPNSAAVSHMYNEIQQHNGMFLVACYPADGEMYLTRKMRRVGNRANILDKHSKIVETAGVSMNVFLSGGISGSDGNTEGKNQNETNGKSNSSGESNTKQVSKSAAFNRSGGSSIAKNEGENGGIKAGPITAGSSSGKTATVSGSEGDAGTASAGVSHGSSKQNVISSAKSFGSSLARMIGFGSTFGTGLSPGINKSISNNINNFFYQNLSMEELEYMKKIDNMRKTTANHVLIATFSENMLTRRALNTAVVSAYSSEYAQEKFDRLKMRKEDEIIARNALMAGLMPYKKVKDFDTIDDNFFTKLLPARKVTPICPPEVVMPGYNPSRNIPPRQSCLIPNRPAVKESFEFAVAYNPELMKATTIPVEIPKDAFPNHCLCAGDTKTGKTTGLLRMAKYLHDIFGMPLIIINNKSESNEWTTLMKLYPDECELLALGSINKYTFYNNPLIPPPGENPVTWASTIALSLCKSMINHERSLIKITQTIINAYKEHVIFKDSSRVDYNAAKDITFTDIVNSLKEELDDEKKKQVKDFKEIENLSGLVIKLEGLFVGDFTVLNKIYCCKDKSKLKSLPEILNRKKIIILDTAGLQGIEKKFVTDYFSKYLFRWACASGIFVDNPFMLFLEEANIMFNGTEGAGSSSSELISSDIWHDIALSSRSFGMYFTLICQLPSKLPDYLINECTVLMTYHVNALIERKAILERMGFDPTRLDIKMANFVAELPRGTALLKFCLQADTSKNKPYLVTTQPLGVEPYDMKKLNKEK